MNLKEICEDLAFAAAIVIIFAFPIFVILCVFVKFAMRMLQ